jgi:predicted RND superfamily exporter protein
MVALAGLDLGGAVLARHWADQRAAVSLVGGMAVFAVLFVVYGKSLDYAELSTVTIGWIVLLQIGVLGLERLDGVSIPPYKLVVIGLILALQVVLTVGDLAGSGPASR